MVSNGSEVFCDVLCYSYAVVYLLCGDVRYNNTMQIIDDIICTSQRGFVLVTIMVGGIGQYRSRGQHISTQVKRSPGQHLST